MNNFLSWHSFLMLNVALALSYLLTKFILNLSIIKFHFTQKNQLIFARCSLVLVFCVFICMPLLTSIYSISTPTIEITPYLHASHVILTSAFDHQKTLLDMPPTSLQIPYKTILTVAYLIGLLAMIFLYVRTMTWLNKLIKTAFHYHKINNINILISNDHTIPFCWSNTKEYYICLPKILITAAEKSSAKKDVLLALRHELQHLRQGDTLWLHIMWWLQVLFFCNPFLFAWKNLFHQLQEFACDEALVVERKTSQATYAQCLINTARQALVVNLAKNATVAMDGMSKSLLYRRVDKLFTYGVEKHNSWHKVILFFVYLVSFITMTSVAFAISGQSYHKQITAQELVKIIQQSELDNTFNIRATPEVLTEINRIMLNKKANYRFQLALQRMKNYSKYITEELDKHAMPHDLLALPLIESGYRPLDQSQNRVFAAGIWQIIPSTAKSLGLVINQQKDERLDTKLATNAALKLLNADYKMFSDWKLVILAYEYGEDNVDNLIKLTGSRDVWKLVRSAAAPEEVKQFLASFDATVILMHNPALLLKSF